MLRNQLTALMTELTGKAGGQKTMRELFVFYASVHMFNFHCETLKKSWILS